MMVARFRPALCICRTPCPNPLSRRRVCEAPRLTNSFWPLGSGISISPAIYRNKGLSLSRFGGLNRLPCDSLQVTGFVVRQPGDLTRKTFGAFAIDGRIEDARR